MTFNSEGCASMGAAAHSSFVGDPLTIANKWPDPRAWGEPPANGEVMTLLACFVAKSRSVNRYLDGARQAGLA